MTGPLYPHGTIGGYTNHRCRCEHCRRVAAAYQADRTARKRKAGIPPDHPAHGTWNGYNNYGCRCEPCRVARSAYEAERRKAAR
jgi:hypothetical protein